MSKMKKIDHWWGCREIRTLIHCWWECNNNLEKHQGSFLEIEAIPTLWSFHFISKCWIYICIKIYTWMCIVIGEGDGTPHSSTLAWKIPWMEEPGGLPSMGLHRVGHDWSDLVAAAAAVHSNFIYSRLKLEIKNSSTGE